MNLNKDAKVLVGIWILAIVLAIATSLFFQYGYTPSAEAVNPTRDTPTTSWFWAPATTLARKVHAETAWTIALIFPFFYGPLIMLVYAIGKYSKGKNPIPSPVHENVKLEVFWTIVPAFVLVLMAIPSFHVLAYLDTEPEEIDVVVDVTGAQFYWQYDFPKYGVTVTDDGSGEDPLVLPIDSTVMLYGQSPQVNHAWWVPAFGLKFDVIPGRTTSGWFHTEQKGFFKGQCAELCGNLHAYMWIHVEVVDDKDFYLWLQENDATWPADEVDMIREILGPDFKASSVQTETASAETPQEATS